MATNCWEFMDCGRQPGGARVAELGVCPAATLSAVDGIHGGRNGGRSCWAVVGTFCGGVVQDNMMLKLHHCVGCQFRALVNSEHGETVLPHAEIVARISAGAP